MKKLIILLIILILGTSPFYGCIKKGTGTLLIMIKDKPPELNITKALVSISSVCVHRTNLEDSKDNESSPGWIILVNESQTYDLILLQSLSDVLAEKKISVGIYSYIRLYVDRALITIDGIEYDLKIPSNMVKINANFFIFEEEITTLLLDFDIQNSIIRSNKDKYILKPNIKLV